MNEKIKISVYQHATFEEGTILFQEEVLPKLLERCEQLFSKKNPESDYPKEEVELQLTQLLQTISLEKSLHISVSDNELAWQALLTKLRAYYPQIVWTAGKQNHELGNSYYFDFIPLAENEKGFPFGTSLTRSLIQQEIPSDEDPIAAWEQELYNIVADLLVVDFQAELLAEVGTTESELILDEVENNASDTPVTIETLENITTDQTLEEENVFLKAEQIRLIDSYSKLENELKALNEQAVSLQELTTTDETRDLNKQALYYEEALRRERDSKQRMRVAKDKLERLVGRLEREMSDSSLQTLEGEVPYVLRQPDWYKKKKIDLLEYDQLYQKAKYLEHTREVNQRLIVISEQMVINETEMKYERERANRFMQSQKDIELFVMMDEAKLINDRVKIKQGFLWLKPKAIIMQGDYDNLVEKAAYFDVIHSENQMLEQIIEEYVEPIK